MTATQSESSARWARAPCVRFHVVGRAVKVTRDKDQFVFADTFQTAGAELQPRQVLNIRSTYSRPGMPHADKAVWSPSSPLRDHDQTRKLRHQNARFVQKHVGDRLGLRPSARRWLASESDSVEVRVWASFKRRRSIPIESRRKALTESPRVSTACPQ